MNSSIPTYFNLDQANPKSFYFNSFDFPNHQTPLPHEEFSIPNSSCISNNSTSDEAEDDCRLTNSMVDERKKRRMISNRESARRSRMRKQRHLDELRSHVLCLRTEHHILIDKLNSLAESHDKILHENARLKEEASDLREMVTQLLISNSYNIFRELDHEGDLRNTAHVRAEFSGQSVTV